MPPRHQVLVIGAGPAGTAAARVLASHGVDVALIDKAEFPRDKLCGGLLTERAEKAYRHSFEQPWTPVIQHTTRAARFYADGRLLNQAEGEGQLYFTLRREFDHFLLQQALAAGAIPILGDALAELDPVGKTCRLRSGRVLGYDFLIGADGVNSLVGKTLFGQSFNPKTVAFALELEIPRAGDLLDAPEIHFGLVRWGYGWVFPKQNSLTAGVGGLHRHNPELKETFRRFLEMRFGALPEGRIKGHHLPFGDYRKIPGQGDILLAGDAAGLVEPITGEGIAFALQSGRLAAEAILEARQHGSPALPRYQTRYRAITQDFDHANRLRWMIFPRLAERFLIRALPRSHSLPRMHLDLMAERIGYGEYSRHILRRLAQKLVGR